MKGEKLTKITKKIPEKPELGIDECVLGCLVLSLPEKS